MDVTSLADGDYLTADVDAVGSSIAGADLLVHSVFDAPVDEEFIGLLKKNRAGYCPTLFVMGGYRLALGNHWKPTDAETARADPEILAAMDDLGEMPAEKIPPGVAKLIASGRMPEPPRIQVHAVPGQDVNVIVELNNLNFAELGEHHFVVDADGRRHLSQRPGRGRLVTESVWRIWITDDVRGGRLNPDRRRLVDGAQGLAEHPAGGDARFENVALVRVGLAAIDTSSDEIDNRAGTERIYFTRVSAAGVKLLGDMAVSDGSSAASHPSCAVDSAAATHVVWKQANALMYAKLNSIGGTLVAEGVETQEELAMLADLGVRYGQGYLLARPAPLPIRERFVLT